MQHSIRTASTQSGVSPHLIRMWERRYKALHPTRTAGNRRVYCPDDITRLRLLKALTQTGHNIGSLATQCNETLRHMLQAREAGQTASLLGTNEMELIHDACYKAIHNYCGESLRALLEQARLCFGHRPTVKQIVLPLIKRVGEDWQAGLLRIGHEHLHTAVVRDFLTAPLPGSALPASAPVMVIATPSGVQHELGALLVSALARDLGVRVIYLGTSLPAEEIAACAIHRSACVIAMSVTFPKNDAAIAASLTSLVKLMPAPCELWLGGCAAESYVSGLTDSERVAFMPDLDTLERRLATLV